MIRPHTTREFPDTGLRLEDFVADTPKPRPIATASATTEDLGLIDGVSAMPLEGADDDRGSLVELLTTRDARDRTDRPCLPGLVRASVPFGPGSTTGISSIAWPLRWDRSRSRCTTCGRRARPLTG